MTDFDPHLPDSADELASAYLDEEATAEERAIVESDPTLMARVAELRAARDAVQNAAFDPPTAAVRDAAVLAAVRQSPVVDMRAARARRRLQIASIAAAIVALVAIAGALIRLAADTSSEPKFSTAAGSLSASTTAPQQALGGDSSAAQDQFKAVDRASSLGTFDDRQALADAARAAASAQSPSNSTTTQRSAAAGQTPAPSCTVATPEHTVDRFSALAALAGREVRVDVFTSDDGSRRLVVTDAASCTELFSQSL